MLVKKYKNELIRQAHDWMAMAIYEAAKIERVPFTFPETEEIIKNEYKVSNKYKLNEYGLDVVINLKRAYKVVLELANLIDYKYDYKDFLYLNRLIGEGIVPNNGNFRTLEVIIKGSKYKPPFPPLPLVWKDDIDNNLSKKITKDSVLKMYCRCMKQQYFNDGNKRTALLFANMLLLSKELGFINIPDTEVSNFSKNLIKFYDGVTDEDQFINLIKTNYLIESFNPTYHKNGIKTNKAESLAEHKKNKNQT